MFAVIFEVMPREEGRDTYFDLAAALREELESVDGFVSVERFESLTTPGKVLSLSFWRDEAALIDWRNRVRHRAAQARGREELFAGYRLRIASLVRDYGMEDRAEAPQDAPCSRS